jgi:basic membrane protein A
MRKIIAFVAAILLAGSASLVGASAAEKLKVGYVYLGPIGDFGWNYRHNVGRLATVDALGDKIETTALENVPEGADSERAIEQLARAGHKLIFATSFGYMDSVIKVAQKYPNVHFEHATGFKRAANVATYSIRWHEGRYIQGVIAAKMSKSGILGYVGSFPIPEVISGINATMLGAQSINPNIKLKIVWVNSWFDPGKEADAAKSLIDQSADVISTHTDSPAAVQVSADRNVFAFGESSDMIKFGPKAQLTALVDNWGPYYTERTKEELEGKWKSGDTWGGIKDKMSLMAPYTNMPDDVKKLAENTEAAIGNGTLQTFKCPVMRQDGTAAECKAGDHLADDQILSMDFYVKGIEDKVPGK